MATNSKQTQETQVPDEVLPALLDYYSDRATSFASLFVASVFGLVTLSAIIRTFQGDGLWYYIAGIPYFAFVLSGSYTWSKFCSYADIASVIEYYGFRERYKAEIEKIPFIIKIGENKYETDLYEDVDYKCDAQEHQPIKAMLNSWRYVFALLYLILIGGLTIITYWDFLVLNLSNPVFIWAFILAFIGLMSAIVYVGWRYRKANEKRENERVKRLIEKQQKTKQQNNPS